jgi:DNA-binding MarR family transcriptional regulator
MTGADPHETPEMAEVRAAARFRSALQRFLKRSEQVTRGVGLTQQRYQLLLMVKAGSTEGTSVTALARRLEIAQTTAVELVSRAADAGLVERRTSPTDARVSLVRLTEEGERRFARAFTALAEERAELARAFGEVDRAFRATVRPRPDPPE